MVMGERGMADMAEMSMPLPDNTLPMMAGQGPYGPLEMGGMASLLKVRAGQKPGDYTDPGWYVQPPGTQAWEWTGEPAAGPPPAARAPASDSAPASASVRKPTGHGGQH
jgi:hypothetical protein